MGSLIKIKPMSKKTSKKNEQKLKLYLAAQEKKKANDTKPNNKPN
jgi:hypothetical protein